MIVLKKAVKTLEYLIKHKKMALVEVVEVIIKLNFIWFLFYWIIMNYIWFLIIYRDVVKRVDGAVKMVL